MKKISLAAIVITTLVTIVVIIASCKTVARAAARYWTNRQIKEFVSSCEDKSAFLLGKDKAHKYCDCAVDVVAQKYKHYEDVKKASLTDVLQIANDCK